MARIPCKARGQMTLIAAIFRIQSYSSANGRRFQVRGYRLVSHQTPDALDEPFDLLRGRVRSAAGAHQAISFMTQHPGNSARVEVTVRHEYAPGCKCSGHIASIASGERERHRGRAVAARRQTVELNSGNGAQPIPQLPQQNRSALLQALRHAAEPLATWHVSLRQGGEKVDRRGCPHDAFVVQRPAPPQAPERLGPGTLNHEGIVGAAAAVDFLASLSVADVPRRERLGRVSQCLQQRGAVLLRQLWDGLRAIPGVELYGLPPGGDRTPTVSFTLAGRDAGDVATALAARGIFVSHGDFYASTVARVLGHERDGLVRAGCAAYTTAEEVERLVEGVRGLV